MFQISDQSLASYCNALAHKRRARIFRILITDPASGSSFSKLQDVLGFAPSSLIHHLREMERCGVILRRAKGTQTEYSLNARPLGRALKTIIDHCQTQPTPEIKPLHALGARV